MVNNCQAGGLEVTRAVWQASRQPDRGRGRWIRRQTGRGLLRLLEEKKVKVLIKKKVFWPKTSVYGNFILVRA